jgi:hypothetical protein
MPAGAIRAYCAGQMFDRARQLAGNNPTFSGYIEEQYNNHLLNVSRGGQGLGGLQWWSGAVRGTVVVRGCQGYSGGQGL